MSHCFKSSDRLETDSEQNGNGNALGLAIKTNNRTETGTFTQRKKRDRKLYVVSFYFFLSQFFSFSLFFFTFFLFQASFRVTRSVHFQDDKQFGREREGFILERMFKRNSTVEERSETFC